MRCQLVMLPIMTPERMTNSNTMMFTAVKILLTIADSLTPNARIPRKKYNDVKEEVMGSEVQNSFNQFLLDMI